MIIPQTHSPRKETEIEIEIVTETETKTHAANEANLSDIQMDRRKME